MDPHNIVGENSCDSVSSLCMLSSCDNCNTPVSWSQFNEHIDLSSESEGDISSANEVSFYKWMRLDKKIQKAWNQWCNSMTHLKSRLFRKRSQVNYFNGLKNNLKTNECIVHGITVSHARTNNKVKFNAPISATPHFRYLQRLDIFAKQMVMKLLKFL